MAKTDTRIEQDSMGQMKVPGWALWGASTERARQNFPISGRGIPEQVVRAFGLLKAACAFANRDLEKLDAPLADAIIEAKGLKQITDTGAIEGFVDQVIADNPDQVQQYREGKTKVIGFLVGQVMKATGGKANPAQVNEVLKNKLSNG